MSETVTEYSCYGWHFLQLSSPTSHVPSVNPHFRYWGYNWAVVGLDDRSLILPLPYSYWTGTLLIPMEGVPEELKL